MKPVDIIIIIVIALIISAAVFFIIKRSKKGGCGCGCEGCTKQCGKKRNTIK